MPLIPNFTAAQATGVKSVIILTDTSTGSDVAVVSRRIFLITDDGSYLVPTGTSTNYIDWALADTTISLNALEEDMSLNIQVDWLDVNGAVLYTKTILYFFAPYTKAFLYYLSQLQYSTSIGLDANYISNKEMLWALVKDAENAITIGGDITTSQNCLDRAKYMMDNQSKYF
jgi:hypothetical protein